MSKKCAMPLLLVRTQDWQSGAPVRAHSDSQVLHCHLLHCHNNPLQANLTVAHSLHNLQSCTPHCAGRHDVSHYMQGSCLSLSELCIQARLKAANESSIPPSAESKALCGVRQVPDAAFLTGGRQGGPVAGAAQAARGASHLRALLRLCSSTLCGSLTLAAQGLPEDLANEVVDRLLRGHRLDPPLLGLFAQAATALRLDAADWPSYQDRVSTAWLHAAAGFRCGRGVPAQLCVTPTSRSPKQAWQHMGPGRKWLLWVCTMHGTSAWPGGHVHRVQ